MYYVKSQPNSTGNHGNPMGQFFDGCLSLPDDLLTPYIEARGFVNLTLDGNTVTAVETNQEALDAYLAEFPDVEPDATPSDTERIAALEEAMLTMMLGGDSNV